MSDISHFRQHGYQVLKNVIAPKTIASFQDFFSQAAQIAQARIKAHLSFENDHWCEGIDRLLEDRTAFEALDGETRNILCGHLHLEARLDPIFLSMAREPGLLAVLNEVFEERPLRLHLPPAARFVLPHNRHAGVPPHQDISYNLHMDDFVTIWVPFVPIDEACGGVGVYHGTGQLPPREVAHSQVFWNEALAAQEEQLVHCLAQPGDALILNPYVLHRSMANNSDRTRFSTDFRFFAEPAKSQKHYLDMVSWQVIAPGHDRGH